MSGIKNGDFVEIDYTGKIKDSDAVFDTTGKDVADKEGIAQQGNPYKPVVICVGENQVISGIDEALVGKEPGEDFKVEVTPEKGFGKKNAKLIRMIPQRVFSKQDVEPQVGLQVQVDGQFGIIRAINPGRVIVDFNNPLAGKNLVYMLKVKRIITDTEEKLRSIISPVFSDADIKIEDHIATIKVKNEVPEEIQNLFQDRIAKVIPEIKKVTFIFEETTKK